MLRNIFFSLSIATFAFSVAVLPVEALAEESDGFSFDERLVVDSESLGEMRGTALSPEVLGIVVFDAISANNTSNGTVSGGNVIDAGAFSHSSGLSTIIQNSGNNVLIQSATIVNLNID
ncbi:MAG: hypothetical protein EOM26_05390 [Alphaproteobacteria bacterium]|nr:hypothetical protein [Alphaproteobacteria bacterium]